MNTSERWYCFANQGPNQPSLNGWIEKIFPLYLKHNTVIWIDIIQPQSRGYAMAQRYVCLSRIGPGRCSEQ